MGMLLLRRDPVGCALLSICLPAATRPGGHRPRCCSVTTPLLLTHLLELADACNAATLLHNGQCRMEALLAHQARGLGLAGLKIYCRVNPNVQLHRGTAASKGPLTWWKASSRPARMSVHESRQMICPGQAYAWYHTWIIYKLIYKYKLY